MNFSVEWTTAAESRLTEIWLGSRQSSQITRAADSLDLLLADRPLEIGESRSSNIRIAFEQPLAITYFVDLSAKSVIVLRVWLF